MKEVVITYVKNGPLVEPAQEEDLPPQMKGLLKWYKGYIKTNFGKEYIYAEVRHEHHFKHYYVTVHMSELFQLFNLRELDKSIISCYVIILHPARLHAWRARPPARGGSARSGRP